jgi:lincosamide nucleotidyltransferase
MDLNLSLETIGQTIEQLIEAAKRHSSSIALIGAGSAGAEFSRMDKYSDIDFFLIVEEGASAQFINDNSWFGADLTIAFSFRDTDHGNKALLSNGVFLEFAIFTETELAKYGIPGLRTLWSREGFILPDFSTATYAANERDISYYVDQALSNLYVGALRMRRGERLAALAMIERFALTNLLIAYRRKKGAFVEDLFNIERRAEKSLGVDFSSLIYGYASLEKSLEAILAFAESNFEINQSIAAAIRALNQEN